MLDNITQEIELPDLTGTWSRYFGGLAMIVMTEPSDDPTTVHCVLRRGPHEENIPYSEESFFCSHVDNTSDPSQVLDQV